MRKTSSIETIKTLAGKLGTICMEDSDCGSVRFSNDNGSGVIRAIKLFNGLEVLSFDVHLQQALELEYHTFADTYLHCLYIQEGLLEHSFKHINKFRPALRFQNVIVGSASEDYSIFKLPPHTQLKFIILTLSKKSTQLNSNKRKLQILLNDVLESLSVKNSYAHFGDFSDQASNSVLTLLNTKPESLINRLLIEANVLSVLSYQFINHENSVKKIKKACALTDSEIIDVITTTEYIAKNLERPLNLTHLESFSGLHQKRIQMGFKHFFGMSVNKYILHLRVLRAKELMETTDLSISEIVYSIGLNSRSYFSKAFSEKFGILPNQYKQNLTIHNPTFELCYISKANYNLCKQDFCNILETSKIRNFKNDITGCLIYHKQHFIQILEGSQDAVESLYEKIKTDSLHRMPRKLYEGIKSGRSFENWEMAFIEKPALFCTSSITQFKLINIELILKVYYENATDPANKLRTKLMWERARNALLLSKENDSKTTEVIVN